MERGTVIHGEFVGDASTITSLLLYEAGSTTALTLASTQTVVITDVCAYCGTADKTLTISDGTIGAGKRIFKFTNCAEQLSIVKSFITPYYCTEGQAPQLTGNDATTWEVFVTGFILDQ